MELAKTGGVWFAREVEVETPEDRGKDERIESQVISADPMTGVLRLVVGGLEVSVSQTTRFQLGDGGEISRDAFFARIQAALAAGERLGVELLRPASSNPQDPYDGEFSPAVARLDPNSDDQILELNVDDRHVAVMGTSIGTLTLLATEIQIDTDNGSVIEERGAEEAGAVEIKGIVASVDLAGESVELLDGTILLLLDGSNIKANGGEGELATLDEVAAALGEGGPVEVEAEAVLQSDVTYIVVEIEFEAVEENGEFEGRVESVQLPQEGAEGADGTPGTFTLKNGRTYTIGEGTDFDESGDLLSLEAMAGALAAGDVVTVVGQAAKDADGSWLVSMVLVEVNGEGGEFEGRGKSVHLPTKGGKWKPRRLGRSH